MKKYRIETFLRLFLGGQHCNISSIKVSLNLLLLNLKDNFGDNSVYNAPDSYYTIICLNLQTLLNMAI